MDDYGDDEEELDHENGSGAFAKEEVADHWPNGRKRRVCPRAAMRARMEASGGVGLVS